MQVGRGAIIATLVLVRNIAKLIFITGESQDDWSQVELESS